MWLCRAGSARVWRRRPCTSSVPGSCAACWPVASAICEPGTVRHPLTVTPWSREIGCLVSDPALASARSPTRRIDCDRSTALPVPLSAGLGRCQPPACDGRHTADLVARASGTAGGDSAGPPTATQLPAAQPTVAALLPQGRYRPVGVGDQPAERAPASVRYPRPLTPRPCDAPRQAAGRRQRRTRSPGRRGPAAAPTSPAAGGTAVVSAVVAAVLVAVNMVLWRRSAMTVKPARLVFRSCGVVATVAAMVVLVVLAANATSASCCTSSAGSSESWRSLRVRAYRWPRRTPTL